MKFSLIAIVSFCCLSTSAWAQDDEPQVNLRVEGRGDYDHMHLDGTKNDEESGFRGKYLNVVLTGEFLGKFAYGYRQRMNKFSRDMHFFDATDWLYLNYSPISSVTLSAGKQVVGIGGYEYDRAPIDLYYCSEFWNNIACYQWGVSVAYDFRGGHDRLLAQACQSPFDTHQTDLYAFNVMWYGKRAFWSTMWSINAIQRAPGRYISYVSLGNEFRFSNKWNLQVDVMNRASRHQQWIFGDYSIVGELNYHPNEHFRVFAKSTHDANNTHTDADQTVLAGTEVTRIGGGLEYTPLKGKYRDWVRLHADYCYTWGTNTNPNGALLDDSHLVNVGLTCRVDVFKLKGIKGKNKGS